MRIEKQSAPRTKDSRAWDTWNNRLNKQKPAQAAAAHHTNYCQNVSKVLEKAVVDMKWHTHTHRIVIYVIPILLFQWLHECSSIYKPV